MLESVTDATRANFYVTNDGAITAVNASDVEQIAEWNFTKGAELRRLYLFNAKDVQENCFKNFSVLELVYLPSCETIGKGSLSGTKLTKAYLPICKSVGESAFSNCKALVSVDLPACTTVSTYAFAWCSVESVNLPACESIAGYAFRMCDNLTRLNLPACTKLYNQSFGQSSITEIHFAAANQATIEALDGYATKFGATDATIYFDL